MLAYLYKGNSFRSKNSKYKNVACPGNLSTEKIVIMVPFTGLVGETPQTAVLSFSQEDTLTVASFQ